MTINGPPPLDDEGNPLRRPSAPPPPPPPILRVKGAYMHDDSDDEPWRIKEERSREETDDDAPHEHIEVAAIGLINSLTDLVDVIAGKIGNGRIW